MSINRILRLYYEANSAFEHGDDVGHDKLFAEATKLNNDYWFQKNRADRNDQPDELNAERYNKLNRLMGQDCANSVVKAALKAVDSKYWKDIASFWTPLEILQVAVARYIAPTVTSVSDDFDKWYSENGYYHDTVSDRKELMREAWNARSSKRELVYDANIEGCPLYSDEETDGMFKAYSRAKEHRGTFETLYAVASYILRKRGHLPPVSEERTYVGCCVSCGITTEYAYADCKIDTRKTVYVCPKTECHDKHEATFCTRNVAKLMQTNQIEDGDSK